LSQRTQSTWWPRRVATGSTWMSRSLWSRRFTKQWKLRAWRGRQGSTMEAVILVGIQGSGKTTFFRERFFDTHVRLSLDMLKTRHRLSLLMRACLEAKQAFVVDNTNVLKSERSAYIEAAKAAGFRVTGYYFRPELRRAIKWNSLRKGKQAIPVAGVIGTMKRT